MSNNPKIGLPVFRFEYSLNGDTHVCEVGGHAPDQMGQCLSDHFDEAYETEFGVTDRRGAVITSATLQDGFTEPLRWFSGGSGGASTAS